MRLTTLDILYSAFSRTHNLISRFYKYPIMIHLEPTTYCNLKCPMCEHSYLINKSTNINIKQYKKVIDKIPTLFGKKLVALNFTGIGENLMNPDFLKILDASKDAVYLTFTDNFTMMNEKVARRLIDLKVNSLFISMDGATKETFEKVRVGAKFEKVIKNLSDFVALKKKLKAKKPEIIMRFVPTKQNIHELPKLIKLAKKIGINAVTVPQFYVTDNNKHLEADNKLIKKYGDEAKKIAKRLNIKLSLRNQKPKPVKKCLRGQNSVFITVKGEVLPCCFLDQFGDYEKTAEKVNFGNAYTTDIKDLWTKKRYVAFRKLIAKGKKPKICKDCQIYY